MSDPGSAGAHTPPATDALRALRRENRLAAERIRAHRLAAVETREERRRNLTESLSADWVTPYAELLNLTRSTGDPVVGGPTGVWQRRYGKNWPIYQTEQELALLRAPARILVATSTYAQGMIHGLSSYVVSTGCTYRVAARQKGLDVPEELTAAAQRIVDEILRRNQWHGGEQPALEPELFERSLEDGEFILTHHARADGWTDFRTQECEQLTQPPGSDAREYGYGILTPRDDVQRVLKYHLQFGDSPSEGEEYEPEEVTHYRRNVRRSMKRGITEFCFDAYDAINLAGRLRTNLGDTAAQQAAIVYVRQHDNGSQDEVQAFVDGDADFTRTDPFTGAQQNVKQSRRGGREDVPKGMNYVPGPIATSTPIHLQVLQACLRGAVVKWNGFEWLISADASNNNYASSLTAESPFVRRVLQEQRGYREAFRKPVWFALKHYVKTHGLRVRDASGSIKVWSWEEMEALLDLLVEAPSPETRNKLEESQRAQAEIPLGLDSRQQYTQRQGRDYDQVEADNQEYADKFGDQGKPLPTDAPPDVQAPAPTEAPKLESENRDLTESVGFTGDGEMWLSDEVYRQLLESARTGLVLKTVTTTDGKSVKRWVRANTATGADQHRTPGGTHGPDHPVAKALRDPSSLTAADVTALADHARSLPKEQLRQLNLAFKQKIGGTKAELANRLLAHVRAQQGGGAPAPSAASPPPAATGASALMPAAANPNMVSQLTREQLADVHAGRVTPEHFRDAFAGRLARTNSPANMTALATAYGIGGTAFESASVEQRSALVAAAVASHVAGRAVPVGPLPQGYTPPPPPRTPRTPPQARPPVVPVPHTFTERGAVAMPTDKPRVPQNVTFQGGEAETKGKLVRFFGRDVDPATFAAAVNAHDGANVYVRESSDGTLEVQTRGDGYTATRTFGRDRATGEPFIHNDYFRVNFDPTGNPPPDDWTQRNPNVSGSALLANQIRAARALGVAHLETFAARSDGSDPNTSMNGYYTWPRLGYDDSIKASTMDNLRREKPELARLVESNPTGSTVPNSILGLMTSEAGRDWWKENGHGMHDMKFDLRADSLSMRTAAAYAQERAANSGRRTSAPVTPPAQSGRRRR